MHSGIDNSLQSFIHGARGGASRVLATLGVASLLLTLPLVTGCSDDPDDPPPPPPVGEIDPPGPATLASIGTGMFAPLPGFDGIYGHAQVIRSLDGSSTFEVSVEGLDVELAYGVHVHALPCAINAGGGHYKIDPTVMDTVEENEIWPAFTTDENGVGRATATAQHMARMDAMSIVIHDTPNGGDKMACADLWIPHGGEQLTRSGDMAYFASAEPADETIVGTAMMTSDGTGTTVTLDLQGLDMASTYTAHVHALPCEVNDAGGHYKLDPTNPDTDEANELWPAIAPEADGTVMVELMSDHEARGDAQSVVIHRDDGMGNPKVACANLARGDGVELQTKSVLTALAAGTERFPNMDASATMYRRLDESTAVSMSAEGLGPNMEYVAHVHEYTCASADGGGHYKIDPGVADTVEENELWVRVHTDSDGAGEGIALISHLVRPEAQSIVLHDPDDGARLACIDLDY